MSPYDFHAECMRSHFAQSMEMNSHSSPHHRAIVRIALRTIINYYVVCSCAPFLLFPLVVYSTYRYTTAIRLARRILCESVCTLAPPFNVSYEYARLAVCRPPVCTRRSARCVSSLSLTLLRHRICMRVLYGLCECVYICVYDPRESAPALEIAWRANNSRWVFHLVPLVSQFNYL